MLFFELPVIFLRYLFKDFLYALIVPGHPPGMSRGGRRNILIPCFSAAFGGEIVFKMLFSFITGAVRAAFQA